MSDQDGRALAIAELIRMWGPTKAVEIVKEADAAHAEGRAPSLAALFDTRSKVEGGGLG
jgi:hypothetical protein